MYESNTTTSTTTTSNIFVYPLSWKVITSVVAAMNFIAFSACLFFLISLLTSSKKKDILYTNAYNIYIFFLIVPDTCMTFMRGIQEMIIALNGCRCNFPSYFFRSMVFIYFFYFTSNIYLNAILTYEMNTLLHLSYRRKKVSPPKIRRVIQQIGSVYILAILCATWVVLDVPWSIVHISNDEEGILEFGSPPYDVTNKSDNNKEEDENDNIQQQQKQLISEKVSYVINLIFVMSPILYVLIIRIKIWKNKLLPNSGRTRVLSLFFLRIVIAFVLFYLPNMIVSALMTKDKEEMVVFFWGKKITAFLTSLQAIVTLSMISYKEDIWSVVENNLQRTIARSSSFFLRRSSLLTLTTSDHFTTTPNTTTNKDNNNNNNNNRIKNDNDDKPIRISLWDEEDVYDDDNNNDNNVKITAEERISSSLSSDDNNHDNDSSYQQQQHKHLQLTLENEISNNDDDNFYDIEKN